MTHKVHPKSFRLKEINDWDSRGFYKKKFPEYLEEDFKIREFLTSKLEKIGIEKIEIERFPEKINIIIFSPRPGLIIGRGGEGIEQIKKILERKIFRAGSSKLGIKLDVREVRDSWSSATLAAQYIAQQIERRMPPRRVLKQALDKITICKNVEGARIEVAGRLNGAEIARREWLKKGLLPRQTIRANIDYAQAKAFCSYGVIGVKVWIYKGERFD